MSDLEQLAEDPVQMLEQQITLFPKKYKEEAPFRKLVNGYLELKRTYKIKLAIGKRMRKSWYEHQVDDIISQYATRIRDDLQKKLVLEKELAEIKAIEENLEGSISEIEKANELKREATRAKLDVLAEQGTKEQTLLSEEMERQRLEQQRLLERQQQIQLKADAEQIVKEKLEHLVKNSSLIKKTENGSYVFNDHRMMMKLEDMFLDEILDSISHEGRGSFMTKTKNMYSHVVDYYDRASKPSEIKRANWTKSIILSAQHGYRGPVYPFIVVGRGKGKTRGSLDTGVIIDYSGSMKENNRMEAARKTGGAINACMRRLNPDNQTFLAGFSDEVVPLTPKELMHLQPYNSTKTHLAIDWLYNTLHGRGPAIAYLITDGAPDSVELAVKSASRFSQNPYLMLRIFLIDGNRDTEEIMRRVGKAAGPRTKIASVKGYQLGGSVIKDIPDVLSEMYDIAHF